MKRRVVITGMGIVSPLGNNKEENLIAIQNGKSGIGRVSKFDVSDYKVQIAGEVRNLEAEKIIPPKELKRLDSYITYALIAAEEAREQSQADFEQINPDRVGVLVGSGIGGMEEFEAQCKILWEKGSRRLSPFLIPKLIGNMASGHIAMRYKIHGINYGVVSACATGTHAMGTGKMFIENNYADMMFVGASEAAITRMGLGGFARMNAITASYNDQPEKASRPFDKDRNGFVMGEGAGVLIIEELEHAKKRGAPILAELVGFGASGDGYHITTPDPDAIGACLCMKMALDQADLKPEDISYINAHGTSTPFNDKSETKAIKKIFGDHAHKVAISSTKSMSGHLLGAAGAIESVFSVMAIQNQFVPPTINYETPDPDCDLSYTPNKAVSCEIKYVLSNSFGFGGQNASLIFKAYEG